MLDELKHLLKHSTIYGLGNVLGKVVGFLMIPFYTHYLTPADYGTLELLDLSLSLTALILTMWLNASIIRHYNDFEQVQDRREAVSTVLIVAGVIGLAVAGTGIGLSRAISNLILATPELHYFVSLEALSFLATTINVVCLSYLRARQRSTLVVYAGLLSLFSSLCLNICFIAVLRLGPVGVLYSSLISGTAVTLGLMVYLVREVGFTFSLSKLRTVISFGAPLILTSAAAFVINFSDRFFLRHFATVSAVGIYALGYKCGYMLSLLVVQPFDTIWQARLYEIGKREGSGQVFTRLFEYYFFCLVASALVLSMYIREVLAFITPPQFHSAYKVVPIVALAYVFQGTNRFFLAGAYIAKKTAALASVGLLCAAVNLALNVVLISSFGMIGAAWSTAASFFLMSALALVVSQRVYRIPYSFSRSTGLIALAVVAYCVGSLVSLPSLAMQVLVKLSILVAFALAVFRLGVFSRDEVERGKIVARRLLRRYGLGSTAAVGR